MVCMNGTIGRVYAVVGSAFRSGITRRSTFS
jgi:hypothetical protein